MQYIDTSSKSVQEVVDSIKNVAPKYGFSILCTHDMKTILNANGFSFEHDCQILYICKPQIAHDFLEADMNIAPALPCKYAVYTRNGTTYIVLSSLLQMIDELNPSLLEVAMNAQEQLLEIIEEAK
jgi:uncharacterized protein (DUF302 family)